MTEIYDAEVITIIFVKKNADFKRRSETYYNYIVALNYYTIQICIQTHNIWKRANNGNGEIRSFVCVKYSIRCFCNRQFVKRRFPFTLFG